MNTLSRVLEILHVDPTGIDLKARRMPIEVPNVGRADLAKLFADLGYRNGAEIGVESGAYSEVLCKANPDGHLYCVDPWTVYPKYREHLNADKMQGLYEQAKARLASYDVTFIRKFSVEAAKDIPDGSLDYVYIDGNHDFQHIAEDLCAWMPKLHPGSIAAGHDFSRRKKSDYSCHVAEVVTAYTQAMWVYPWFLFGSKDVKPGEVRDTPRSWAWVIPDV